MNLLTNMSLNKNSNVTYYITSDAGLANIHLFSNGYNTDSILTFILTIISTVFFTYWAGFIIFKIFTILFIDIKPNMSEITLTLLFVTYTLLSIGTVFSFIPATIAFSSQIITVAFTTIFLLGATALKEAALRRGTALSKFLPKDVSFKLSLSIIPIELLSTFFRPISVSFRLLINTVVGHILMRVVLEWILVFYHVSPVYNAIVAPFFFVTIFFFELLIGLIQAYIFSMLVAVYMEEAFGTKHFLIKKYGGPASYNSSNATYSLEAFNIDLLLMLLAIISSCMWETVDEVESFTSCDNTARSTWTQWNSEELEPQKQEEPRFAARLISAVVSMGLAIFSNEEDSFVNLTNTEETSENEPKKQTSSKRRYVIIALSFVFTVVCIVLINHHGRDGDIPMLAWTTPDPEDSPEVQKKKILKAKLIHGLTVGIMLLILWYC